MLTKDITKPGDETIRGQQAEVPGLDFAQIVETGRSTLLLNIFTIAQGVPSLMTAVEEKMQENDNTLLKIVAEMMPRHPRLQGQLQQIVDKVGKITEVVEGEAATAPEVSVAAFEAKPPSSPLLPEKTIISQFQQSRNVRARSS